MPDRVAEEAGAAVRRPPGEVAGDIRDRLAALVNTAQVLRMAHLAHAGGDPAVLAAFRRIERQVECLGRLVDELDRE